MIVTSQPSRISASSRINRLSARVVSAPGWLKVGVTGLGASLLVLGQQVAAYAQTTTAPVQIEFDTDVLFAQVNDWITVFLPILGIGIAIAIALALITFVGSKIVNAFKGGF